MKKIFTILLVGLFLLGLVSASLQSDFINETSQNKVQLTEEECSSIEYKIFSPFLKNFIFEIKTLDTNEHFFLILKEKDCLWYIEVLEEIESEADITITGTYVLNESFAQEEIQSNTLKGKFLEKAF